MDPNAKPPNKASFKGNLQLVLENPFAVGTIIGLIVIFLLYGMCCFAVHPEHALCSKLYAKSYVKEKNSNFFIWEFDNLRRNSFFVR